MSKNKPLGQSRLKACPSQASQKDEGVNTQAVDPSMVEALEGTSNLQLYQLKSFIKGLLAARATLHLRQPVQ